MHRILSFWFYPCPGKKGDVLKTSEIQQLLVNNGIRRHSGSRKEKERGKEILKRHISDMLEFMQAVAVLTKWIGV